MEYIIDFGSWNIEAKDEEEARKKVKQMLEEKDYPSISNIEEA